MPGVKITQLYIKLDKKLILDVEEILIQQQSNGKNSVKDIKKLIDNLPLYLKYFQNIHIEKLKVDGNEFVIEINDNILFLDNKFINISAKPIFTKNRVSLDLYSLYLKDLDLLFDGDIIIDYDNIKVLFNGRYSRNDLKGSLVLKADDKFIDFNIDSNDLKDIHFVKDFITLNPTIEKWMYDNVIGTYKLNNLEGRFSSRNFQPLLKSFKAQATITNANIKFHENLVGAKTELLTIELENDNLYFDLSNPKYKNIDINGSNVVIYNLSGNGSNIDVNLVTKNRLDHDVLDIIKAYGTTLPIVQIDGVTNSKLTINVDFKTSVVTTHGDFYAQEAKFKINDLTFLATNAKVGLYNNIVHIKDTQVNYKDNLEAMLDLKINTKSSTATGNTKIKYLDIKNDKYNIINLKDKESNVDVDFSKDINIYLDKLSSAININDKTIDVNIEALDVIYSDSEILKEMGANYGELFLAIYDLDDIYFKTNIHKLDLPIKRDNEFLTSLKAEGTIVANVIDAYTLDKKILVHMTDEIINLEFNDTDIVFDIKNSALNKVTQDINLLFNKSNISLSNDYSFDVDDFNIIKNDKGFLLSGKIIKPNLPIQRNGKKLDILDIKGEYINKTLNVHSVANDLILNINENDAVVIGIKDLDVLYDTNSSKSLKNRNIVLNGENSNIVINDKYKLLSNKYNFVLNKQGLKVDSFYKNSSIKLTQSPNGYKIINGDKLNSEQINKYFNKELITGGKVSFTASGLKDNMEGKILFKDNKIKNLTFVNNLILFLNTSPALINPFLILPAAINIAKNKGVSVDGYYIKEGKVNFSYDLKNNIFDAKKISTEGNIVDFNGFAKLDFEKSQINSTMNVSFLKAYTNFVKDIPIFNYVFLGDDKKITTKVDIKGDLNEPEYTTNIVEDSAKIPFDMLKRIFKLPKKAIDSLTK